MKIVIRALVLLLIVSAMVLVSCEEPLDQAQPIAEIIETTPKQSVVFIAGFDEGDNTYYANAKAHFENQNLKIVDSLFSAEEIITWLNTHHNYKEYEQIHIVSHSNPWRGMSMKVTKDGQRITTEALAEETLPKLQAPITENTQVIFHSCGLGENMPLLRELKKVFSTDAAPQVMASPYFNVFGGKYAGHYLAKPYYGFYPTAESPGPYALAKEFKETYPDVSINWFEALKIRQEQQAGAVYTYKFNIPVTWEFTFDDPEQLPQLKNRDDIMDWISEDEEIALALHQLNIPIEKYRWRSSVSGNTLTIKGKTTVLCVMQPVMQKDEYRVASIEDTQLYRLL